jgi:hypothetical protein
VEIEKLQFRINSHKFTTSILEGQITRLKAENKDAEKAKKAARKLDQQLVKLKRYLFVKICNMFS